MRRNAWFLQTNNGSRISKHYCPSLCNYANKEIRWRTEKKVNFLKKINCFVWNFITSVCVWTSRKSCPGNSYFPSVYSVHNANPLNEESTAFIPVFKKKELAFFLLSHVLENLRIVSATLLLAKPISSATQQFFLNKFQNNPFQLLVVEFYDQFYGPFLCAVCYRGK